MSSSCGESQPRPRWKRCRQALATGLPRSAQTNAGLLALLALRLGERYELAASCLTSRWSVPAGRATRPGRASSTGSAPRSRSAQGSLHDAQVEAETGLLLVEKSHFVALLLVAVAITVHIERGALDAAADLAQTGEALGIAEPRPRQRVPDRPRPAADRPGPAAKRASRTCCGAASGSRREGCVWPSDWRAYAAPALASLGDKQLAARLAREQLAVARRVGAPGALGMSLRAAALAIGGDERLALLAEAVAVLERSPSRLELAYALADLGAELSRSGRRTRGPGRPAPGDQLAGQCGAVALAESAMAELQAGPGRRAAARADRAERADRGGVAGVPSGGRGADQP